MQHQAGSTTVFRISVCLIKHGTPLAGMTALMPMTKQGSCKKHKAHGNVNACTVALPLREVPIDCTHVFTHFLCLASLVAAPATWL